MHSRMRARVDSFLKVLNRAKPEIPEDRKNMKTARYGDNFLLICVAEAMRVPNREVCCSGRTFARSTSGKLV